MPAASFNHNLKSLESMPMIVECQEVSKLYQQDSVTVTAVEGVDLQVEKGDFISLSGPSGSGKTTLLNLIGGLDVATSGTISVDNQRMDKLGKEDLARVRLHKIGFVFQAYNLIPVLSARENIEFILQLQGVGKRETRKLADEALDAVGLPGLGGRRPGELSGGQQQRVAIARAIVSKPAIVLADEPTANLDSVTTDSLLTLMSNMNEQFGITFIVATHDPRVIEHTRRRVRLRDGRIIADERVG